MIPNMKHVNLYSTNNKLVKIFKLKFISIPYFFNIVRKYFNILNLSMKHKKVYINS